jgi:hypothetical protein
VQVRCCDEVMMCVRWCDSACVCVCRVCVCVRVSDGRTGNSYFFLKRRYDDMADNFYCKQNKYRTVGSITV